MSHPDEVARVRSFSSFRRRQVTIEILSTDDEESLETESFSDVDELDSVTDNDGASYSEASKSSSSDDTDLTEATREKDAAHPHRSTHLACMFDKLHVGSPQLCSPLTAENSVGDKDEDSRTGWMLAAGTQDSFAIVRQEQNEISSMAQSESEALHQGHGCFDLPLPSSSSSSACSTKSGSTGETRIRTPQSFGTKCPPKLFDAADQKVLVTFSTPRSQTTKEDQMCPDSSRSLSSHCDTSYSKQQQDHRERGLHNDTSLSGRFRDSFCISASRSNDCDESFEAKESNHTEMMVLNEEYEEFVLPDHSSSESSSSSSFSNDNSFSPHDDMPERCETNDETSISTEGFEMEEIKTDSGTQSLPSEGVDDDSVTVNRQEHLNYTKSKQESYLRLVDTPSSTSSFLYSEPYARTSIIDLSSPTPPRKCKLVETDEEKEVRYAKCKQERDLCLVDTPPSTSIETNEGKEVRYAECKQESDLGLVHTPYLTSSSLYSEPCARTSIVDLSSPTPPRQRKLVDTTEERDVRYAKCKQESDLSLANTPSSSSVETNEGKEVRHAECKQESDLCLVDTPLSNSSSLYSEPCARTSIVDLSSPTPPRQCKLVDTTEENEVRSQFEGENTPTLDRPVAPVNREKKDQTRCEINLTDQLTTSPLRLATKRVGTQTVPEIVDSDRYEDAFDESAWTLDDFTDTMYLSSHSSPENKITWPDISVPCELFERLYPHQKVGVQWMASLFSGGIGGVLGDDMGMGKTYQTLTYIGGLMRTGAIRNALIVAPLSVLITWEREASFIIKEHCVPRVAISVVSSDVQKSRRRNILLDALHCSTEDPHIVITTYGVVKSSELDFLPEEEKATEWDVLVLDEGHMIKNPSAVVSKSCRRICQSAKTRRLLLSGTPIQNNLKELWALFDWATSGKLLGKLATFEKHFAKPIEEGRDKGATEWTMKLAEKQNRELQNLLRPYFLQRTKESTISHLLPTKRELVVWTQISRKQRALYEDYLRGEKVASVLGGEVSSPLEAISWLKNLCGHPRLVQSKKDSAIMHLDDRKNLVDDSVKLGILVSLIDRLKKSGHRTLVFSQSTKMLDIIEHVLCDRVKLLRIDGSTKQVDRQRRVDDFNDLRGNNEVLLVSTRAGGLGLTLTGADRCVVYDPSWNPAEDSQAVDRCYRISQTRAVTVYRLIAAGTVESKMYEKQVHKDGIRRTVTSCQGTHTERLFDKKNLHKLFELSPAGECAMLSQLDNGVSATGSSGLPTFLSSLDGVVGVTSHDLVYSESEFSVDRECEALNPFNGTPAKQRYNLVHSKRVLDKENMINLTEEFS